MSYGGAVELVQLEGFAVGGRWSGSECRDHQPYLAQIPVSRYIDPEEVNPSCFGNSYKRTLAKHKSKASEKLAGPHWMKKRRNQYAPKPVWETPEDATSGIKLSGFF